MPRPARRQVLSAGFAAAALAASRGARGAAAPPQRYPDPAIKMIDKRFARYRLGNTVVQRLYTGCLWAEGTVWFADGRYLLWSDIPNDRILKWDETTGAVSVFRQPANFTNGHTRDREGRLLSCEHGTRRVTRTEHDGTIKVLLDRHDGKRLNAPNDIVVHPDGAIWFTDPGYGALFDYEGNRGPLELPPSVYRLDPATGKATVQSTEIEKPNGICFSPDWKRLYVSDTARTHRANAATPIHVFDVTDDGKRLQRRRRFVDMGKGWADGIRCDVDGNLWASAGWAGAGYDGVHVFAPDGDLIGRIELPEICGNLCFGGAKRNRLFMAGSQSLYAVYVETRGALWP